MSDPQLTLYLSKDMQKSGFRWKDPYQSLYFLCHLLLGSRWVDVTVDSILLHSCANLLGYSIGLVNLPIFHYHSWVSMLFCVTVSTFHKGALLYLNGRYWISLETCVADWFPNLSTQGKSLIEFWGPSKEILAHSRKDNTYKKKTQEVWLNPIALATAW